MLTIGMDKQLDSIFIEFESGTAGYSEELDDNRIVDYSLNPGKAIGVCLHHVSDGVLLDGLPELEQVRIILAALGIKTHNQIAQNA